MASEHLDNLVTRGVDRAHRSRNLAEYEGTVDVDENLVAALIRVTEQVASRISEVREGPKPGEC